MAVLQAGTGAVGQPLNLRLARGRAAHECYIITSEFVGGLTELSVTPYNWGAAGWSRCCMDAGSVEEGIAHLGSVAMVVPYKVDWVPSKV